MTKRNIKEEGIEEKLKETADDTAETEENGKEDIEEKEIDETKGEEVTEDSVEDSDTRYMRLMADFQNYKKRIEKEKKDLYSYANEKIMTDLLAVIDNFDRALEQEAGEGFKEGMAMVFKQLSDVLTNSGLEEISALGEDFDHNLHNAVMTEDTDEYESGKVSEVIQKGYSLNGKVIRHSMVKVAN